MDREAVVDRLKTLIAPHNARGVQIAGGTRFADDLELDSLTVMDLVASIEDEWDINMPLQMLPDLETVDQVADAVVRLAGDGAA